MITREQFYKSKKWEDFRKVIIQQRTDADGYVHCCRCGKPILKKYDLILHHKQELTDANVGNALVALNPDNVECICFKCHNKEHERFQGGNSGWIPQQKKVFIVYGAPCAGKSTWVHDNAAPSDLVVDVDQIWQMISVNDKYVKPGALKSVVFQVRDTLFDVVKYRNGKWNNAFVIATAPMIGDRDRLKARIAADELIHIDTPEAVCIERCLERGMDKDTTMQWVEFIKDYFAKYQCE